jgi:hypothetical protein
MIELLPDNVEKTFRDCLFKDGEIENGSPKEPGKLVKCEVIMNNYGLNKDRVELHRQEIIEMLSQLPDQFQEKGGGGWSFLNMCNRKDGEQWTGLHSVMEELVALGMAIERVKFQMPREMWGVLPGGMPYLVVLKGE